MNSFELDLTNQIKAKCSTTCDNCGAVLGESYARGPKTFELYLDDGADEMGYPKSKRTHWCNEKCLREGLNKRTPA